MSTYKEPTPLDDSFPRANQILKNELSKLLESFVYTINHENQDKSCISRQLYLNEGIFLARSKEIGGKVYILMQKFMQISSDYANGHGKVEKVYKCLELLKNALKS